MTPSDYQNQAMIYRRPQAHFAPHCLKGLMGEVGELVAASIVDETPEAILLEGGDVIWWYCALMDSCQLDFPSAMEIAMQKPTTSMESLPYEALLLDLGNWGAAMEKRDFKDYPLPDPVMFLWVIADFLACYDFTLEQAMQANLDKLANKRASWQKQT